MQSEIRVIQYGVGPIGLKVASYLIEKPGVRIVGAIDADPYKIGRDLGELAGLPSPIGLPVSGGSQPLLKDVEADVVILTTTSTVQTIYPQVMEILSAGKNVVSSCEELVYPWHSEPGLAAEMDRCAKEHRVSVLSTGVNPGFLMDFLPLVITGVCRQVTSIRIERIQDAQHRRIPFQKKIGAGLTVEGFNQRVKEGVLRHVGLVESIHLLAAGLGWKLDQLEESIDPVIVSSPTTVGDLILDIGMVAGVRQIGRGFMAGREAITLVFQAAVGEPNPHDRIAIKGTPEINLTIESGINGDIATSAIIVNALPSVINAAPGLRTMADVGLIAHWA